MTILRTDNVRSIRGWLDLKRGRTKPQNHESVLKKPFDKKSFIFKVELLIFERLGLVCFLEQRDFDDPGIDDLMNRHTIPNFGDLSGRKHDMTILRTDNVRSIRGWLDLETWTDNHKTTKVC